MVFQSYYSDSLVLHIHGWYEICLTYLFLDHQEQIKMEVKEVNQSAESSDAQDSYEGEENSTEHNKSKVNYSALFESNVSIGVWNKTRCT